MRSGAQRAPHDVEVEPVVGGVDDHVCALQRRAQRSRIAGVHVLLSLEPEVPRSHVRAPALEERRDVPSDRARCPDDGDHVRIVSWRWSSGPRVSAFWPPASSSCRAGSRPRRSSSPAPRAPASRTSTARRYIDFAGGLGCQNTGHGLPAAVAAMHEQIDTYLHQCFMVGIYEPYVEVCRRLAELSPCSGREPEEPAPEQRRRGGRERGQDRPRRDREARQSSSSRTRSTAGRC